MDNKTELENKLHKMIYDNSPANNPASQTHENKWRCQQILVGKLVELIETEKLFALLQEPPKLHLQGKI
jgi:hypothetical protein